MRAVGIQERPSDTDSFGAKGECLDDICAGPHAAVHHDVDFVKQVWPQRAHLVQQVNGRGGIV